MSESITSAGDAAPPVSEDQAIRQTGLKGLTSQVFCSRAGFDPDGRQRRCSRHDRWNTGRWRLLAVLTARVLLAETVKDLDEALAKVR